MLTLQLPQLLALVVLLGPSCSVAELWQLTGAAVGPEGVDEKSQSLLAFSIGVRANSELLVGDPAAYDARTRATTGVVYRASLDALSRASLNSPLRLSASKSISFSFTSKDKVENMNFTKFGTSMSTLDSGEAVVCAPGYNHYQGELIAAHGVCLFMKNETHKLWMHHIFNTSNVKKSADKNRKDEEMSFGGFAVQLIKQGKLYYFGVSGPLSAHKMMSLASMPLDSENSPNFKVFGSMYNQVNKISTTVKNYLGYSLAASSDRVFATHPIQSRSYRSLFVSLNIAKMKMESDIRAQEAFLDYQLSSYNYLGYSSLFISAEGSQFLLLGAPYGNDARNVGKPDRGCVFFFSIGGSVRSIQEEPPHYCSDEPNGRFGTSLANVGDINGDGIDDFAVGCPGCYTAGAVYFFFGRREYDKDLRPYEILRAANLSDSLSGFGFSLANARRSDTRKRLAVGAVNSGHVVLLQTKAICEMKLTTKLPKVLSLKSVHNQRRINIDYAITCRGINMKRDMGVMFRVEEYVEAGAKSRFNIKCKDEFSCSLSSNDFSGMESDFLKLEVSPAPTSNHHVPLSVMLSDVKLKLEWNFTGYPFEQKGVIVFNDKVFEGTSNKSEVPLIEISHCEDCGETDISLRLVGPSFVSLEQHRGVPVTLEIIKGSGPFFGGVTIKVAMSEGVSLSGLGSSTGESVTYFSQEKEILLSEVFPLEADALVKSSRTKFNVSFELAPQNTHAQFKVSFKLGSHADASNDGRLFGTKDSDPSNNEAELEIKVNTSLVLDMYPKKGEDTIVDVRKQSNDKELRNMKGPVHGSYIGPPMLQTYKLIAAARPSLPVENISVTVRVPFVTDSNDLLLYFARKINFKSGRQWLPGLPYFSTNEDETQDTTDDIDSCQLADKSLAHLLYNPDLSLYESAHTAPSVNRSDSSESGRRRVARSAIRQLPQSENSSVSFASSDSETTDESSQLAQVQLFDCDRPEVAPVNFRCISFSCRLSLQPSTGPMHTFLHLHARLWSPTFFKHRLAMLKMKSTVQLDWEQTKLFGSARVTPKSSFTQTFLFEGVEPLPEEFPWGYVVLAIFIGLWLLLLFILLLWYCNFFRRKKFDYESVPQKPPANDDDFYH